MSDNLFPLTGALLFAGLFAGLSAISSHYCGDLDEKGENMKLKTCPTCRGEMPNVNGGKVMGTSTVTIEGGAFVIRTGNLLTKFSSLESAAEQIALLHDAIGMENLDPLRHVAVSQCHGYRQTCNCPPHQPTGGTVLDPFTGIGTTGQTARQLSTAFVGIDLNAEYLDHAKVRIAEPPRWFLRQQKPKTKKHTPHSQLTLFGM